VAARLDEVDLVEAPVVRREVDAATAHEPSIEEDTGVLLGLLVRRRRERLRLQLRVVDDAAAEEVLELVVLELSRLEAWSLLEHHDSQAGRRELFRDDPPGRA